MPLAQGIFLLMLYWLQKLSERKIYFLTACMLCLLIIHRNPIPLFRPELWGEDGAIFFADPFYFGTKAVFFPVWSSFDLLARIIALAASFAPALYIPGIYAWTSFFLYIFVMLYFLRNTFGWLIPTKAIRVFVVLLMATNFGSWEVQHNLSNLIYVFGLFMALLSLERPLQTSLPYLALWVILSFSSPIFFMFLPYHFGCWLLTNNKNHLKIFLMLLPAFVMSIFSVMFHWWDYNSPAYGASVATSVNIISIYLIAKIIISNFVSWVFFPLTYRAIGIHLQLITMSDFFLFSIYLLICGLIICFCVRKKMFLGLLYMCFCVCLILALQAITRAYYLPIWERSGYFGLKGWNMRHTFILGALSTIFWLGISNRLYLSGRRLFSLALALAVVYNVIYLTNLGLNVRKDLHWPIYAENLDEIRNKMRSGKLSPVQEMPALPVQQRGRDFSNKFYIRYPL